MLPARASGAEGGENTVVPSFGVAGVPLDPSGGPLLAAKFSVPAVARGFVRRQRLLDRLTDGTNGPLTVVTGAAGAGKTILVSSWTQGGTHPGPVVWVTLDSDDTPGVIWAYIVEALRRGLLGLTGDIGMPVGAGSADHSMLVRLCSALERLPEPVVLVLDGLDKVPGREVTSGLGFVLDHAGPRLRLVLTSREDPSLPLHRYRTEDRLYEIRGADLAFTPHEVAVLLRGHGLVPGRETVEALTSRTEGWAAGLRLCALAMEGSGDADGFVRSFTASEHAVADYLTAEILDAQPAATRELLLRVSILDRVHPDLANALTGRQDAEGILTRLTRANAFVEPLADTGWCRFHPLFAAVLHAHLRSRRPGLEPRLHRRAARWFTGSGQVTEALAHAAAGGDWKYGAAEAVRHLMPGRLLADPEAEGLEGLFSRMPADVPGAEPALVAAACHLSRRDPVGCRACLARAEYHLDCKGACATPEARLTHVLLRLLSEPYEQRHGGADGTAAAEEAARHIGELMAQLPRFRIKEHPEIEALRRHGPACALLKSGRLDDARTAFADAARACTAEATHLVRHQCLGRLALAEGIDGALTLASDHARCSLAVADQHGIPQPHRSGAGHLALATVACERGEVSTAIRHIDQAEALPDTHDDPVLMTERAILWSRVELAQGRWAAALAALDELVPSALVWPAERLAVARSTAALARGDHATAISALDGAEAASPSRTVALALAHLAAGHTETALHLVAPIEDSPGPSLPDRVRIGLLRTRAAMLGGDRAAAHALLAQALDAARPEQLRRPFTEARPWMRHLLHRPDGPLGVHAWLTARPPDRQDDPILIEPLSGREREVLAYLERMMTTDEIAAALHLSVNTVKTHLRSIYRKLCVSSRREAVERGREFRLL
ncbi:helix-turn-helix transcriptional regulator [Streptomyces inhibens]|uniref:Helix-turn-helix transcriptional regulator n=1 Tax=Streptomyces inhibens TaxID=2293571 RepID=A0A371PQW0_STRIH|nr:LuxR C-terminal-related transcriptional regulator [Streptomyces inhibens]REK84601.1 helix-turn-helix transcriptional regulator [Streptomyces inhibens]